MRVTPSELLMLRRVQKTLLLEVRLIEASRVLAEAGGILDALLEDVEIEDVSLATAGLLEHGNVRHHKP